MVRACSLDCLDILIFCLFLRFHSFVHVMNVSLTRRRRTRQRFEFCGNVPPPTWLVTEVEVLAKLTSVKIKLITKEIARQLCEGADDRSELDMDKIRKCASTALGSNESDVRAVVSCVHFILKNAVKHEVEPDMLHIELEQLGCPRKSCAAVVKVYDQTKQEVLSSFREHSLKLPRLESTKWRVDYVTDSSHSAQSTETPVVQLELQLTGASDVSEPTPISQTKKAQPISFEMTSAKFNVLYHELKTAYQMMEKVE